MRSGQVIGAALLVWAAGVGDEAEARGRGGRGGARSGVVLVSTGTAASATATRFRDFAREAPEAGLRPIKPVTAPVPAVQREVRAAAPWCANRPVVGSGTGFCLIN